MTRAEFCECIRQKRHFDVPSMGIKNCVPTAFVVDFFFILCQQGYIVPINWLRKEQIIHLKRRRKDLWKF